MKKSIKLLIEIVLIAIFLFLSFAIPASIGHYIDITLNEEGFIVLITLIGVFPIGSCFAYVFQKIDQKINPIKG